MTKPHDVAHLSERDCRDQRDAALDRLGMSLEEARAQWDECGCCLVYDNWEDLRNLEEVRDMDYLLGEGDYA